MRAPIYRDEINIDCLKLPKIFIHREFSAQVDKATGIAKPLAAYCVCILTLGFLAVCIGQTNIYAQVKSSSINGIVSDASGATVPGAHLIVTEQTTQVTETTDSNGAGEFTVPYLKSGTYTVEIQKPGFKSWRIADIILTEGQQYRLTAKLSVGSISEAIDVLSNAAQLQTESSTVQGTIGEHVIQSIPNTSQNPLYYATLQAGVVGRAEQAQTQSTQSFGIGEDGRRYFSAFNVNGGTAFTNDIQLDGLTVLGSAWNEATVLPNTDSLQEVRVITNNYAADLGRGQGVVQMETKSGTNSIHGSAYYRGRNEALNANSYANNYQGIRRGAFKVNDFGGSLGGPILHDKLFIFTSYEQLLHSDSPQWLLNVPTAAQRIGDFSKTLVPDQNGAPTAATIYNPYSIAPAVDKTGSNIPGVYERAIYPGAIIPNPSPQSLLIMNSYPLPNRTASDVYGSNNFFVTKRRQFKRSSSNSRLDYHPNDSNSIYISGGVEIGSIITPSPYGANSPFYIPPTDAGTYGGTEPQSDTDNNPYLSIGDTITLNPTTVLDIRYGIQRVVTDYLTNTGNSFTAAQYTSYGVPDNVQSNLAAFGPAPDIPGGGNFSALNNTSYNNKKERQTNSQVVGSITKTTGTLTLRAGSEYRVGLSNYNDFTVAAAAYAAAGTPTAQFVDANGNNTAQDVTPTQFGYGGANILTGEGGWNTDPSSATRLALAQKYFAAFSQNDWHPTDKLTINVGLRWEVQPGPTDRYNRSGAIDLTKTNAFGTPGAIVFPGNDGLPRNLWQTTWNDYQPRLGVSYRALKNLVVRGGYGISYVPNNTGYYDGPYAYGTGAAVGGTVNKDFGPNPDGKPIGFFYDAASSQFIAAAGSNSSAPQVYGVGSPYFNYRGEVPPRIQQWNFFVEQQFSSNWLVSLGYVASRGNNLQSARYPIQNDQSIPSAVTQSWRQTYIATAANGGAHNPGNDQVSNPLQPSTGPLREFQGALGNSTITRNLTYYPYLALFNESLSADNGLSNYNSMLVHVQHALAQGLLLDVNYVWSKSTDSTNTELQDEQGLSDTPGGSGPNDIDLLNPANNKKISFSDVPQRFVAVLTYESPFGATGRFALTNRFARVALGGWNVGSVVTFQSGFPLPATNNYCSGAINCRPNRTGQQFELPKSLQRWYNGNTTITLPDGRAYTPCSQCFLKFNPDAFSGNVVSVTGSSGPSTVNDIYWTGNAALDYAALRGPGRNNVDLSVSRNLKITERVVLTLSANASNAFNHTQFLPGSYSMDLGGIVGTSTTPGVVPGQGSSNSFGTHGVTTYDPRQIVLEGRFRF